jgi:hypothetical protein
MRRGCLRCTSIKTPPYRYAITSFKHRTPTDRRARSNRPRVSAPSPDVAARRPPLPLWAYRPTDAFQRKDSDSLAHADATIRRPHHMPYKSTIYERCPPVSPSVRPFVRPRATLCPSDGLSPKSTSHRRVAIAIGVRACGVRTSAAQLLRLMRRSRKIRCCEL